MKRWKLGAAMAALVLGGSVGEALAVPTSMMFSGRLSSPAGNLDGDHAVEFRLYHAQTGGEPVWTEAYPQLMVEKGLVFAALGSKTTLDTGLFEGDEPLFLQVTVDGTPLLPRSPIGSVPYAFRAEVADRLGDLLPGDVQRRVEMGCPDKQFIAKINDDGTVICAAAPVAGGDIGGVAAGTGLTGGGTQGDVSLAVDFTKTQARVLGTCSLGEFVQKINQDGAVSCGAGITSVTAGTGITVGGTGGAVTVAVNTNVVQARVSEKCAAGQFMTGVNANGTPICATDSAGTGDITGVTAGVGLSGGSQTGNATLSVNPLDFYRHNFDRLGTTHFEIDNHGSNSLTRSNIMSVKITAPAAGKIIIHAASNVAWMNPSGFVHADGTTSTAKSGEWGIQICDAATDPCPSSIGLDSTMLGRFNYTADADQNYYYSASTFIEYDVDTAGDYTFHLRGQALGKTWMRYSRNRMVAQFYRDPVE